MAAGLPVVAPAVARIPSLVAHDGEGWLYDPSAAGSLAEALERLTDAALRRRLGEAARARARSRVQLDGALRGARRRHSPRAHPDMNLLLATDAFPPICGGSGWSTYELARGLRARGHQVTIVQPRPGGPPGERATSYDGLPVLEFGVPAPSIPFVRNYFKNERLYASLAAVPAPRRRARSNRSHPRATCPDDGAGRRRGQACRHSVRRDGSRLLAGVLLVGSHSHARRRGALPGLFGGNDDAVHPAARRRVVAARPADDSVHARESRAQAGRARRRGRGHRGQHHDRGGPARARAGVVAARVSR